MGKMIRIVLFSVFIFLTFNGLAQKHTFTNNRSEYKNFVTGETLKSEKADDITIEAIGNGLYELTDSRESMTFKFSHMEGKIYVYKILNTDTNIKSGKKMSEFAKGVPGKFAIDSDELALVFIYSLDN